MIYATSFLAWEARLNAPLLDRIGMAPQDIVGHVGQYNVATNNPAVQSMVADCPDFLDDIRGAVSGLPDLLKRKLELRLLGIFVMSGLGSLAVTDVIAYPDGKLIGAIIAIDVDVFAVRRANEWASRKENSPVSEDKSIQLEGIVSDSAEDSRQAAIQYILLHEFGHVIAAANPEEETSVVPGCARHAAYAERRFDIVEQAAVRFLGLAPFLRLSIGSVDLRQIAVALVAVAEANQNNPYIWMNLSTAFFATEQRSLALVMQAEGLKLQRTYRLPATRQPAKFTLLMLMAPGDLAENTPLDCLLEDCDVDLVLYFTTRQNPLPPDLPAHDAVMVAFSDTDDNRSTLKALEGLLCNWPKPVINAPQCIPNTERSKASALLQDIRGLRMPPTREVTRDILQSIASGSSSICQVFDACRFPIIVRPVGSHAGRDLERIGDSAGMVSYLARVEGADFYISNFIDYRSEDGKYRKYRIAIIAGEPFACHMAISSQWMIHYVNAGMYGSSAKRAEEAAFMANFAEFVDRHGDALIEIYRRTNLEYLCIDCAEANGDLLIFEIDHAMVVHAMDSVDLFPHKQEHMFKVQRAVEDLFYATKSIESSPMKPGM